MYNIGDTVVYRKDICKIKDIKKILRIIIMS